MLGSCAAGKKEGEEEEKKKKKNKLWIPDESAVHVCCPFWEAVWHCCRPLVLAIRRVQVI